MGDDDPGRRTHAEFFSKKITTTRCQEDMLLIEEGVSRDMLLIKKRPKKTKKLKRPLDLVSRLETGFFLFRVVSLSSLFFHPFPGSREFPSGCVRVFVCSRVGFPAHIFPRTTSYQPSKQQPSNQQPRRHGCENFSMADFASKVGGPLPKEEDGVRKTDEIAEKDEEEQEVAKDPATSSSYSKSSDMKETTPFDPRHPLTVVYCPTCSMPPEFCEFGQTFDKCLPWIRENCPESLSPSVLAALLGEVSLEDADKKQRGGGAAAKKTKAAKETKVVIARIQRQKKKFVTAVVGLDSVPDLNIKVRFYLETVPLATGVDLSHAAHTHPFHRTRPSCLARNFPPGRRLGKAPVGKRR